MKNLVIIDSNISDVEAIVSSLTSNTDYILFNYHLDTFKTICSRIQQPYENVSIIQHKYNVEYFCMVQSMQPATLFENASTYNETEEKYDLFKNTLSICDPSLNSWQDYIQNFLLPLKENGAKYIDLLACELWADENWVYAINFIKENYDIHIRASLDITGAGGDFILESDNIDTVGLYFTENILNYKYSFVGIDYSVLLSTKPPWGIYSATNWDASTNKLKELRGLTAKDATTSGTITRGTIAGNGAGAPISYIGGNTAATVVWPAGSIPTNFTVCSITRKSIVTDGRVLNAIGSNWLHGHWSSQRGVAHYNTWYTSGSVGTVTDWLVMCGKLTGTSPYHMLADDVYRGTSISGSGNAQMAINQGQYPEVSNFEFSYLLIWDQVLTDTELMVVNMQLNNYMNTGILPPVTYTANNFTNFLYNNPPWGIYSATNWSSSTNTLNEMRGITARNATTSGVSSVSASGNGASSSITYLQGTTTSTISWPYNTISPKFTVVSLTRYVGTNRNRILTSPGGEWIHGHYSGNKGYVYYNGNAVASGITSNLDNWVVTAGSSNGTIPFNILLDGSGIGTSLATSSSSYGLQMGINTYSTEKSDFAFSYIFVWDKELTYYELRLVSDRLTTYLSSGTLPQIKYTLSAPTLNTIVYDTSNLIVNFTPSTSILDTSGIYYYYNYTNSSAISLHTVPFINGFFGFPQVTDNSFSYVTSIPGWNLSASVGTSPSSYLMMRNTGSVLPAPSPLPTNVTQFMGIRLINAINKPASLSQTIFLSPGTYTFTFSMASAGASLYNANHVVSVSVGSTTLLDKINLSNSWTNYSYDVSFSTFGKYVILFSSYTTSNADTSIFVAGVNFVYKTSIYRTAFNPNMIQNNYFFGNALASANTYSNVTSVSNWTLSTTNNSNATTPFILVAGNAAPTYTSSVLPKDIWQYVGFRISTANLNATLSQSFFLNRGNYNLSYYTAIKPNTLTSITSYISTTTPGTGMVYNMNAQSIIINPLTTTLQGGSQTTALPVYAVYLEGGDKNGSSVDWLLAGYNGTTTNMVNVNVNVSSTNLYAYVYVKSARSITTDYTIGADPVLLNKAWGLGTPVAVTSSTGSAGFGISRLDYYVSNQSVNAYLESFPLESLNSRSKTACVGAFSLQRIFTSYTGPTIKVRRSADSSNVDFYADSVGNMGTGLSATGTSLESWLNTSTGYITIWYDQSGKGNHATQSNTSTQPIIDPSNKWIDFKSSRFFTLPNGTVPSGNSSYTVTYRHNNINTGNGGVLGSGNYGTQGQTLAFRRNNAEYATYWWNMDTVFGTYRAGNMVTETYLSTSRVRTGYVNGISVSTKTETADRASTTANNTIGVTNSTEYMNGELYTVYIFNTALSDNERGIVERSGIDASNQYIALENNYFTNPSYAANTWAYVTDISGWKLTKNNARDFAIANGSGTPWNSNSLPYGITQFLVAQVNGYSYPSMILSKPVAFTSGNYSLSFYHSARANTDTTVYYLSVSVGTIVLVNALYTDRTQWQEAIYNFNIPVSGTYNLTFTFFCNQSSAGDHAYMITGVNIAKMNSIITLTSNEHSAISWLQKSYDFNLPYYGNYALTFNATNSTATETVTYLSALNLKCNSLLSPAIIQNAREFNNAISFITVDENTYSVDSNTLSLGISSPVITSVTAAVGTLTVNFTFSGGTPDGYYYSTDGTNYLLASGNTSPIVLTGLTNGTTYNITLKAILGGTLSLASNSVSGTPRGPPSAPTINSLVAGDRQLTINYTAGSDNGATITSYTYTITREDQVTTTVNVGTSSPIVITGLLNNIGYSVFINAINAVGTSPNSNTLSSTPIGIPYPPTIVDYVEGNKQVSIIYESANNGGYTIVDYKYSLNGGAYISGGNVITSPLTITGLVNLTTYTISIMAVNTFGNSVPSNFASITPSGEALPPTLTTATVGNGQLTVAFTPPTNNGGYPITNYYYSINDGNTYSLANTIYSPYTITGLTNGTAYTIRFITVNTYGNSVPSSSIVGTPATVPDAPLVTLTPFNGYLSVAFTVNFNGGNTISSYKYSLNNASYIVLGDVSSPFLVTGLTNGLPYSVRVIATNSRGDSAPSASVSTTPIGNPPPPTITSIEPFNTSMIVYFNPPITNGGYALTTYKYALNVGGAYTNMNTTTSPYTITGVTAGVNYSVNIVATNSIGDSSASNVVSVIPKNSINYEKALSLEWNGQIFVLSVRNEMNMNVDYLYSYDGLSWTGSTDLSNSTFLTSENAYNVKWLGSSYVMMGNITNSSGNTLLKSMDGVNYSPITTYSPGIPVYDLEKNIEHPHSITFPKNIVIALGGIASSSKIAYSYDEGVTWTSVSGSSQIFNVTANNAFWNGKTWVAVGSSINTIATSPDGINWVGRGAYIFTTAGYCVAWSKEKMRWVAGGEGLNSLAYSSDGVFWTGIGNGLLSAVYDVVWNGNMFVAVGTPVQTNKCIAYSYDGISWSLSNTNFNVSSSNVSWNGNNWICIGRDNGSIGISSDGINWLLSDISGLNAPLKTVYADKQVAVIVDASSNVGIANSSNFGNVDIRYNKSTTTVTGQTPINIPTAYSANLVKYFKFEIEDLSNVSLLNYANSTYEATVSSTDIITGKTNIIGNASLNIVDTYSTLSNNYVNMGNVSANSLSGGISISYWMRPSEFETSAVVKSHSTIFELGNGRGQDTVGMYLYGNTLATNVINGNLIGQTMNFTAEVTPFGTSTTVGSNTPDSTISSTVSNCINITLSADGKKMIINSFNSGYIYYSKYNTNTSNWGPLIRTYGTTAINTISARLTSTGNRCVVASQGYYIYYFDWIDSSNNYSQLIQINDTTQRGYQNVYVSPNGDILASCVYGGHVYYSYWNNSISNYGTLIQATSTSRNYIAVSMSPNSKILVYASNVLYYRTWDGTTYANETIIASGLPESRNIRFSHDGNILFYAPTGSNVKYTIWNNNTFTTPLIDLSSTIFPSYDYRIFDITADGTIFYGGYGGIVRSRKFSFTNQDIGLITNIDISNTSNTWCNITWTISSSGIYKYYIDASLVFTDPLGIYPSSVARTNNYIGTSLDYYNTFNGGLDDFMILNRELTQSDVSNIIVYKNAQIALTTFYKNPDFQYNSLFLSKYYRFNLADVSGGGTRLLNYATNIYDASLSSSTVIDGTYEVNGTASLSLNGTNNYITIGNVDLSNAVPSTTALSFSFWMRPSSTKSHSTIFELGNGRGQDTVGMYLYGNTLATNVINDSIIGKTMNFTAEVTPFGTSTTAGSNTPGSTVSTTVSDTVAIALSANGNKMVIATFTSGYLYYSSYNTSTQTWSSFTRTYGTGPTSLNGMKLTHDGNRGVVASRGNYIYYFDWIDSSNNYSQFKQINDNNARSYQGATISANGERIFAAADYIYYSDWNSSINNYGALVQVAVTSGGYIGVAISPNLNVLVYASGSTMYYRTWNGSSYANEVTISTGLSTSRNIRFSHDGNILFHIGSSGSASYTVWNKSTNAFNTPLTSISTSTIPSGDYWPFDVTANGTIYYPNYGSYIRSRKFSFTNQYTNLITNIDISNTSNTWRYVTWTISSTGTFKHYLDSNLVYTDPSGIFPTTSLVRYQNYIGNNYSVDPSMGSAIYNCTFVSGGGAGISGTAGTTFKVSSNYSNVYLTAKIPIGAPGSSTTITYIFCTATYVYKANGVDISSINVDISNTIVRGTQYVDSTQTVVNIFTNTPVSLNTSTIYALAFTSPVNIALQQTYNEIDVGSGVLFYNPTAFSTNLRMAGTIYISNSLVFSQYILYMNGFSGGIDDFVIYRKELTQSEISNIYKVVDSGLNVSYTASSQIVKYYKFNTIDTSGALLYNYASNTYDASLSNTGLITTAFKVYGTGSLSLRDTSSQYVNLNTISTIGSNPLSFSFNLRTSSTKSHSTIFELGNGRGRNTIAMYIMGNTIVSNVINGNLSGNTMYFTTETTPFGTGSTAGTDTIGSTISNTVSDLVGIALTADGKKMVIHSFNNSYTYYSLYNTSTQSWGVFTRTYGTGLITTNGIKLNADGTRGVIARRGTYIYYFKWIDSSNNYSQFTQISDTNSRNYLGTSITPNGERIAAAVSGGHIYYSDWNTATQNYNALTQVTSTTSTYSGIDISPNGKMIVYGNGSGFIWYRIWNGTSYVSETIVDNGTAGNIRNIRFTHDGNAFFCGSQDIDFRYYVWNASTNNYAFGGIIPSSSGDNWALSICLDGTLYRANYGGIIRSNRYSFITQKLTAPSTITIDISNTANTWRNITWTISPAGTYKYYLDASLVFTDSIGIVPSLVTRTNNYIGTSYILDNSYGFLNYLNGGIDDFVIYNKELSQQEISNLTATNQIKTVAPLSVTKNYTTRPASSDYVVIDNSFNPITPVLLIQKKSYTPTTTTATFNMNTVFNAYNNGNVMDVSYVGSPVFSNQPTWGPQQLFDNTRTIYDWATQSNEPTYPYQTFTFPMNIYVSNIFIIPRQNNDSFPLTVDLYVDNVKISTYSQSTLIYGTTGHFINYTGFGINVNCNTSGKVWQIVYNNIPSYIGEIEFWGYVIPTKLLITTSKFNDISNSLQQLLGTSTTTVNINYGYNFSSITNNSTYYLFSTDNRIVRNTKILDISFADMLLNLTTITDMSGSINHISWNNPNIGTPSINPLTIACGEGANTLAYSYDGIYWSGLGKNIFTTRANKAIWNGILWVAVGTGQYWVATSYDGVSWVGRNSDIMTEAYDIAWNGSYMVAVGYGNATISVSRDGIQWYAVPNSKQIFTIRASAILWTSKSWVAYGSGTNKVMISSDPTAWIWTTPATQNPIFTNAIPANSASNGVYNVYASSSIPSSPASKAVDNTTSDWQTATSTYNATTGAYTGSTETTYYDNNGVQYSVSGEWIHVDYKIPFVADYYLLAWAIDTSASQYTIPKKWTVLVSTYEDYTGTNTWGYLASYEYSGSLYPSNTYSYPYFVKLQNVNSNAINSKSYRIVVQNILPGGSNTFARIGELNFYSKTDMVNPYVKPILTRTHLIYQTNASIFNATGDNTVSIVADLCGNVIDTSFNGGYYTTSIISGIKTPTSHCFDGKSIVMAPLQGNSVSFIKNTSLNTHLGTDFSLNGQLINSINGNTYACCFNGKRILLGGSGTNKITYNTVIENSQSPVFTSSLNANSLFTTVYGLASNPGYGHVYCENRIYFNPGDKVSIVTPKAYSESIQQKTTITMNLNASNTVKNITLPSSSTIATIIGPRGPTGPSGVQPDGPIGHTGIQGVTGNMGPLGITGEIGPSPQGDTGTVGNYSSMDNTGPTGPIGNTGYKGIMGMMGVYGLIGPEGPTGAYGPIDPDNWIFDGTNIGTIDKTLTIGSDTLLINTNSLEVLGNVRATTARNMFDLSYTDLIINKINVGNTPINTASMSITGNVHVNNLFIGTNTYSSTYTTDISGVLQTNKLKFPKIIQQYSLPTDISSTNVTIDYKNSKQIWVDASSLEQNFSLTINGFSEPSYSSKIHNITLTIDYANAGVGRYYCNSLNIDGNSYPISVAGGNPPVAHLTTLKTQIKQEINIVYVTNNIWKILSSIQLYE